MRWMKREEGKVSIVEFVDKLLNLLRKVIVFSILNRNTTRQDIDRLKLRNYRVSYRRDRTMFEKLFTVRIVFGLS